MESVDPIIRSILRFDSAVLGYRNWIVLRRGYFGACDVIRISETEVGRCHPAIIAEDIHAKEIGCNVGDTIIGVRWIEPFNGQEVCF